MVISRMQLVKELEPGLNALFGLEYDRYENQDKEIFDSESSDRAFEEEVMLGGFANAAVKPEGQGVSYEDAQETYTARYTNETIALAFALTEEAVEDNLYDKLSTRYTKALARSMANTKQVKAANILNRAFNNSYLGGDAKELCATDHPTLSGDQKNELSTAADLNETSLEQMLIDIADMKDERGMKIALRGMKMIIPVNLQFVAERLMKSAGRVGTADNDINAIKSMGMVPEGYVVNNFLTDTDSYFLTTDVPNGFKMFVRSPIKTAMEGDFDTGNVRFKARERYSFGFSDPRAIFGNGKLV